jgi:hypothetical protein
MVERAWAGALLLGLSIGCAGSSKGGRGGPDPTATASDYAPLKIGASYTYAMVYPGQTGEMTVTIQGEKDGYRVDNRGGAFRQTQEGLRDKDRFLIRHPLAAGNKWTSVTGPSAVEHYEILSVGEPCESAAGPYKDCLIVLSTLKKDATVALRIKWTWARGIGLVKLETEAEVQGRGVIPQVRQTLTKYAEEAGPGPGMPDKGAPGIRDKPLESSDWEQ